MEPKNLGASLLLTPEATWTTNPRAQPLPKKKHTT